MEESAIITDQSENTITEISNSRRFWWYVYCVFILLVFVGLPLFTLLKILQDGGDLITRLSLSFFVFLPFYAVFIILLFLPHIIQKRILLISIAILSAILVFFIENTYIPVKYFFPDVFISVILWIGFVLLCIFVVLPIGITIRNITWNWWISYQSPKTINDLAQKAPSNLVMGITI